MMVAQVMLLPFSHGARTRDGFVSLDTLKILILDSKRANAKLLRGVLSTLGVRHITSRADTTAALNCLRGSQLHAVFCDGAVAPDGPAKSVSALRKDATLQCKVPVSSSVPHKKQVERAALAAQHHAAADRSAYGAESEWRRRR
jgi:CheY-like chemotaxis protein